MRDIWRHSCDDIPLGRSSRGRGLFLVDVCNNFNYIDKFYFNTHIHWKVLVLWGIYGMVFIK